MRNFASAEAQKLKNAASDLTLFVSAPTKMEDASQQNGASQPLGSVAPLWADLGLEAKQLAQATRLQPSITALVCLFKRLFVWR